MASSFPYKWGGYSPAGRVPPDWGDDGYQVDRGSHSDGSSVVNTWKLAMGAELAEAETRCYDALARFCTNLPTSQCLVCVGQHQAPLMRADCSQSDFGSFCAPRVALKVDDRTIRARATNTSTIALVAKSAGRKIMLWTGHPCMSARYPWPGNCTGTSIVDFLAHIEPLRDVVDVIGLEHAYYLAKNAPDAATSGGLVRQAGVVEVVRALQLRGWQVEPMIAAETAGGVGPNGQPQQAGENITNYRPYFQNTTLQHELATACAREARELQLHGFNFDFEFSGCATAAPPCGVQDGVGFGKLLDVVKGSFAAAGLDCRASVDTGQSAVTGSATLNASAADLMITMDTYYETWRFDIALPRDLHAMSRGRFGLGVCPRCSHACHPPHTCAGGQGIPHRLGAAVRDGVLNIAFWNLDYDSTKPAGERVANQSLADEWWTALRQWKNGTYPAGPKPAPPGPTPMVHVCCGGDKGGRCVEVTTPQTINTSGCNSGSASAGCPNLGTSEWIAAVSGNWNISHTTGPTTTRLVALRDTFLKKSERGSSALPAGMKHAVKAGAVWEGLFLVDSRPPVYWLVRALPA